MESKKTNSIKNNNVIKITGLLIAVIAIIGLGYLILNRKPNDGDDKNKNLTSQQKEAIEIVKDKIGEIPEGFDLDFDKEVNVDKEKHYMVYLYEEINGNIAKIRTYSVKAETKALYIYDIVINKLIPYDEYIEVYPNLI